MKILLVCGSVAEHAHTRALIHYLQHSIEGQGGETIIWDLAAKPLPIAEPKYHSFPEDTPNDNVKAFVKLVREVDGFVLGSPLYHGSYSGVLKNALDNLHYDAFRNKPVGLVSHSSNFRNCVLPCDHLRPVIRALFGYPTQTQIGTTNDDYQALPNGDWELINPELQGRAHGLAKELLAMAQVLHDNPVNQRA